MHKLGESLFCLSPQKIIKLPEECAKAFETLLSKLLEANWRYSHVADDLLVQ